MTTQTPLNPSPQLSSYQVGVIILLSLMQFSVVLDFMVLTPLGAILMPELKMTASQFGFVVSAYAFSAGISAFLTASVADSFDRKKLLLFFYIGFTISTLACGLARNFPELLVARISTGLFGGVISSIVFAIISDLFSIQQRGQAIGFIQSSFAASQVFGIPLSLFLSNQFGWHAPFFLIVTMSIFIILALVKLIRPIRDHLAETIRTRPMKHLIGTLNVPRYQLAFLTTGLITLGGYILMPFSSAFIVNNLRIDQNQLPIIYMVTGVVAFISGPLVGRLADRIGLFKTFFMGAILSVVMVNIYTHLESSSLLNLLLVNSILFVGIFSRLVPSQTLISSVPEQQQRGSFMAVNSSLQQMAGGFGSVLAGIIVKQDVTGKILNFELIGYTLTFTVILSTLLIYQIGTTNQYKLKN